MEQSEKTAPKGIGGWLILPLLGLILSPLRLIYMIYEDLWPIFSPDYWDELTSPGSPSYHSLWKSVLIFEVAGNLIVFLLGLAALVSFLRKSRRAPRMVIIWFLLAFVFVAADVYFRGYIPGAEEQPDALPITEIWRIGITAVIWVPYFMISKRVRATFLN
ncbi:MAG: DUF2569 domain-containing protein [Blastocatellia bacterium]|nr:DUF2569 domain-containing protein [Blastocatellia bacterium]